MGQLVHFYAGDPATIGRAFGAHDFATLNNRDTIPLFSDFSLHLSPIDYDFLTEAIAHAIDFGPTSLTEALETQVGAVGNDGSADIVAAEWVRMVAAVNDQQIEGILAEWMRAVAEEHGEPVNEPTDDVRVALRELIALCQESLKRGIPVVHTWSL
jgi:hypothetical protein